MRIPINAPNARIVFMIRPPSVSVPLSFIHQSGRSPSNSFAEARTADFYVRSNRTTGQIQTIRKCGVRICYNFVESSPRRLEYAVPDLSNRLGRPDCLDAGLLRQHQSPS